MCTAEQLQCVSSIKVDKSECLQQCSGLLVTSFDKNEIEDRPVEIANALVDKLTKFMSESHYLFQDMAKNFKGFCINLKFKIQNRISVLSKLRFWRLSV